MRNITEANASPSCPASFLQRHENISFYIDENAAALLTRNVAPWLVGPCEWTPKFIRKAVVWLCEQVHKPILKLTQGDYLTHGLGELLEQHGPYSRSISRYSTTCSIQFPDGLEESLMPMTAPDRFLQARSLRGWRSSHRILTMTRSLWEVHSSAWQSRVTTCT